MNDHYIPTPISQHIAGKRGIYTVDCIEQNAMNVKYFRDYYAAEDVSRDDMEDIERDFWRSLRPTMEAPLYGADSVGTLFDNQQACSWNVNQLETILSDGGIDLPGITRAMLYFGMYKSMFALHSEDMDLYSINYLHYGAPKFWYAVPTASSKTLENLAQSIFPEKNLECNEFLRHKTCLISTNRLKEFNIPYCRALQEAGEFMITFPRAYHEGFNTGFNAAEAVNFATYRWIPKGLQAKVCKCRPDSVAIDMNQLIGTLFSGNNNTDECYWKIKGTKEWLLACACGKVRTDKSKGGNVVDEDMFECTSCGIWVHTNCVYGGEESEANDDLTCHRCRPFRRQVESKKRKADVLIGDSDVKVRLDGDEYVVKIVDRKGDSMRVHYKGYSFQDDEWISIKSIKTKNNCN